MGAGLSITSVVAGSRFNPPTLLFTSLTPPLQTRLPHSATELDDSPLQKTACRSVFISEPTSWENLARNRQTFLLCEINHKEGPRGLRVCCNNTNWLIARANEQKAKVRKFSCLVLVLCFQWLRLSQALQRATEAEPVAGSPC